MGRSLNSEHKSVKANYLMLAGPERKELCKSNDTNLKDHSNVMDILETWCKPNSNEIAVFMQLRAIKQDCLILSELIANATRLVDYCNHPDNARNRLLETL